MRSLAAALIVAGLAAIPASAQTQADSLEAEALAAFGSGQTQTAVELFETLATIRRDRADVAGEARARWRLTVALRASGNAAGAANEAREALALARSANADDIAAEAINQLHQLGQAAPGLPSAQASLDEALRLAVSSGSATTIARIRDARARWLGDRGQLDAALDEVDAGVLSATAADDDALLAGLLSIRSTFLNRQGLLGPALASAVSAQDAAARAGPRAEVTALFVLAQAQANLSNYDEAARLWTEVIERYRELGPPIGVAIALDARCHVVYEQGRYEDSLADAQAAIEAFASLGQRPVAPLYSRAALALIRLGRTAEAREWLTDAESSLAGAPGYERIQALQQIGSAYLSLDDNPRARGAFDRMLMEGRARKSLEDEWKAQTGLGRAALAAGRAADAVVHLESAAAIVEELRRSVPAQELRAAYLARRVEAHEWLAAALMAQSAAPGDRFAVAAFEVAERARVRALADLLAESRHARDGQGDGLLPTALSRDEVAARLAPGEALVEYLVGERQAFAWLLTRDSLVSFVLPAPHTLDSDVRVWLATIAADDREGIHRLGGRLTRQLLGPLLPKLAGLSRVIFVPDGPLLRLPFAALPVGTNGEYLALHVAPSVAGSASLLDLIDRHATHAVASVLALAAPGGMAPLAPTRDAHAARLGSAVGEVRDVLRALRRQGPGVALTDATEPAFKSADLSRYRVIHIAAHAVVNERAPRDSAVLLQPTAADDGALKAFEVANLPLDADLVVLAACRTQLGRLLRGEGLLSLSRSFTAAGARAVVASLWDVGDAETRALIATFYERLDRGSAADAALAEAQRALIASGGPLASPRVWAGYELSGEGRRPVFDPSAPPAPPMFRAGSLVLAVAAFGGGLSALANRKARGQA